MFICKLAIYLLICLSLQGEHNVKLPYSSRFINQIPNGPVFHHCFLHSFERQNHFSIYINKQLDGLKNWIPILALIDSAFYFTVGRKQAPPYSVPPIMCKYTSVISNHAFCYIANLRHSN